VNGWVYSSQRNSLWGKLGLRLGILELNRLGYVTRYSNNNNNYNNYNGTLTGLSSNDRAVC
jgi:hypothetical protein